LNRGVSVIAAPKTMLCRKWLGFWLVSGMALIGGGCLAQIAWSGLHHRYSQPEAGFYRHVVTAHFSAPQDSERDLPFFLLDIEGQTPPHWTWDYHRVSYDSLPVSWYGEGSSGTATVSLPHLSYDANGTTGVLTRDVLALWLHGRSQIRDAPPFVRAVDVLHGYITAAGSNSLPVPRHHSYSAEAPVSGVLHHAAVGTGVASWTFGWFFLWLVMVTVAAWQLHTVWRNPPAVRPPSQTGANENHG